MGGVPFATRYAPAFHQYGVQNSWLNDAGQLKSARVQSCGGELVNARGGHDLAPSPSDRWEEVWAWLQDCQE
jgi:hypothetical protein